jgi:hypothetical protein
MKDLMRKLDKKPSEATTKERDYLEPLQTHSSAFGDAPLTWDEFLKQTRNQRKRGVYYTCEMGTRDMV